MKRRDDVSHTAAPPERAQNPNNGSGLGAASGASLTVNSSDVFGNTAWDYKGIADPTGSGGNIAADPKFRASGDYHLSSGSLRIARKVAGIDANP